MVLFAIIGLGILKGVAFLNIGNNYPGNPFDTGATYKPIYTSNQLVHFHAVGFVLAFIFPLLVLFYSLGWRNFHKKTIFRQRDLKS